MNANLFNNLSPPLDYLNKKAFAINGLENQLSKWLTTIKEVTPNMPTPAIIGKPTFWKTFDG
ncbi:42848_t:CDS:2 [Gigaspora margarita]|uniref:42848_t:CDS:1 n=1 Tax=Gigaspora margarita TaxID=4874 RepID=A0ABN7UHT1_GIGMA|nr:42848_t:CDS:2 [Gigaspora margarita]